MEFFEFSIYLLIFFQFLYKLLGGLFRSPIISVECLYLKFWFCFMYFVDLLLDVNMLIFVLPSWLVDLCRVIIKCPFSSLVTLLLLMLLSFFFSWLLFINLSSNWLILKNFFSIFEHISDSFIKGFSAKTYVVVPSEVISIDLFSCIWVILSCVFCNYWLNNRTFLNTY